MKGGLTFLNTAATSKEEILCICRIIIQNDGIEAVNIRNVAKKCNISVGTVYNYFDSKYSLLAAVVENVWRDIFDFSEISFNSFLDLTAQIFNCIKKGEEKYPSFFSLHSVSFIGEERQGGRRLMSETLEQIKDGMCTVLEKDKNIRNNVFDEEFTPRAFSEIILSLIISAMLRHDYDSRAVLKMIEKLIY